MYITYIYMHMYMYIFDSWNVNSMYVVLNLLNHVEHCVVKSQACQSPIYKSIQIAEWLKKKKT